MVPVGYAFGSFDEMGDGAFRKVRRELGVTAFGVNVLVLPPGIEGRPHYHEVGGESRELGPGDMCHVESKTPRRLTSIGDENLVLLVVGGKGGYVGRDGRPAEPGTY
jgi:quercetin dioxygenase-like cupin family protein